MKPMYAGIPGIKNAGEGSLLLIAGPCVVESKEIISEAAGYLVKLSEKLGVPLVFKSSYRKANRSRPGSFSGIGDKKALEILSGVREKFSIPVLTDIHSAAEAAIAARYVDVIQIPAFLCRQTDILEAAASTGKWINIKKGQFMSGASMCFAAEKVRDSGNDKVMLTERGNSFGYNDLVVDFRNIPEMKKCGAPVIMDITHSLQKPNQPDGTTLGMPEMAETLGLAAIAAGADGIFMETHPMPDVAKCDGSNMIRLAEIEKLLSKFVALKKMALSLNQK
ncbi:MAG TPA: 3-deoxy-8-phosphooctulonate synthase [Bacteroidales bacterium]|nr:3-deoxy-8-phosphooctulonate synthase [Bacteroidales bacterium]